MSQIFQAIGSLFTPPPSLNVESPAMPDPNSAQAKQAAMAKQNARAKQGRQGTIYSGQAYSGLNLGGTNGS